MVRNSCQRQSILAIGKVQLASGKVQLARGNVQLARGKVSLPHCSTYMKN